MPCIDICFHPLALFAVQIATVYIANKKVDQNMFRRFSLNMADTTKSIRNWFIVNGSDHLIRSIFPRLQLDN